jgi:hypothetical protein
MKKILLLTIFILLVQPAARAGADGAAEAKKEVESQPANLEKSIPEFGYMKSAAVSKCTHKKGFSDWQALSPIDMEGKWYFRMMYKEKPSDIKNVLGVIEYSTDIKDEKFYFYGVPSENKGNLVRFTPQGAFIRKLKYPVFSFIFLDVELDPEIQYLVFPLTPGSEWEIKAVGFVDILALFRIKVPSTARFKASAVEDVVVNGRALHTYKISSEIQKGDGKAAKEENWFAAGVGLIYSETDSYTLELVEYVPGEKWRPRYEELTTAVTK